MGQFEDEIEEIRQYQQSERFQHTQRVFTPRQVAEQRGTVEQDYTVARNAAAGFYDLLREKFSKNESITSFGPYSPGQIVQMKRAGIEGIYLGGWATSAKGSTHEDPGPDLASYPLSQVPDEAGHLVRALLTADKKQRFARARMSPEELEATPEVDYRPFLIADADTGHGGDGHVRNLVRRFVEVGVPGYHMEDQKPGVKKCGHQGGKVLVSSAEQISRLSAARLQLDIMNVPGIIVARTDAEAANLLDNASDERDQPFILGATKSGIPSYKAGFLAMLRKFYDAGVEEINGFKIYALSDEENAAATAWLDKSGVTEAINAAVAAFKSGEIVASEDALDQAANVFVATWSEAAGLKTIGQAIADTITFRQEEGTDVGISIDEWLEFASKNGFHNVRAKARELDIDVVWDAEIARTPEGYYQVQGGIPYAVAKSLAAAPFADLLWMETKTADLKDAKEFADAIHAVFPHQMLAYNLSPSFNWDTTGMNDEQMRNFPKELGKMGFVFNFMTYAGHQIDGMVSEEFTEALQADGMLALARLQRKLRLLESPYRTPQTLVGGPRADAGLLAAWGQTATTKAMGEGSTQTQHLVQTEVPPKVLADWLTEWAAIHGITKTLRVQLRPHTAGTDVLELSILDGNGEKLANIVFAQLQDRRGNKVLSVRDQNTFDNSLRRKRLATLMHLFLIHRYGVSAIHYLPPTEDNHRQTEGFLRHGIFSTVSDEVGDIIVADINADTVAALVAKDSPEPTALIKG